MFVDKGEWKDFKSLALTFGPLASAFQVLGYSCVQLCTLCLLSRGLDTNTPPPCFDPVHCGGVDA